MNHREASDLLDRTAVIPVPPVHAERWRNLWMLKDGRCEHGYKTFNTEKAASDYAIEMMANGLPFIHPVTGRYFERKEISFVLQMPVSG